LDARVGGRDVSGLRATATGSGDADAIGIDVGPGEQVVDGANAVPNFPTCEIGAGEIGEIAEHRVFGANQVVAALSQFRIPELTALTLTDRIPGDDNIAALYESLADGLIIDFSFWRMSGWNEYGRMLLL